VRLFKDSQRVSSVYVEVTGADFIKLTWLPPKDPQLVVDGYQVRYQDSLMTMNVSYLQTIITNATLYQLQPQTAYTISVCIYT